ncbi:MAG: hypothetical protein ABIQ93_17435, partial [Saprospiraceae bacterium]
MKFSTLFLLFSLVLIFSCKKENSNPADEKYFPKVKTIIQNNCLSCHSSTGSWAGRPTAFDTDEEIVAAAANIKAVVADPVTPGPMGNPRMPQDKVLAQ